MIIDTNVYSAIDMGVQSATDILDNAAELLIPLPVVAELRFGFVRGSRRAENESRLQTLLSQPNVQGLCPTLQTSVIYAELQLICVQKGRVLSQNDIWIAALAKETGGTLVTFDKDFKALSDIFGDKLLILE